MSKRKIPRRRRSAVRMDPKHRFNLSCENGRIKIDADVSAANIMEVVKLALAARIAGAAAAPCAGLHVEDPKEGADASK